MAFLGALAWHQVREKPQLSGSDDESMMVGTLIEETAEASDPRDKDEALADAAPDACDQEVNEPRPESDCPDTAREQQAPATRQADDGV